VNRRAGLMLLGLALLGPACGKVPIQGVEAGFLLADATWFAEEQTLFVFWEVEAEQGIDAQSVLDISWSTDDGRVPWTPITDFTHVHGHVPVDCGPQALCGSASLSVPLEPREVVIRLRYHRDGELALNAETVFNVVGEGPPHTHRSLIVYGVFDEPNERVQWRGRHQFPTLRNHDATRLGLRRAVTVRDPGFGRLGALPGGNPYIYGVDCPADFTPAGLPELSFDERAAFHPDPLPVAATTAAHVCAQASVIDATGSFTSGAFAQKNPEVRPAFPALNSPVRDAVPLKFFLAPCDREISAEHQEMQRQRLQMEGLPITCIDDWQDAGFEDELLVRFRDAVDAQRPQGEDMVLVIGLHQDEIGVARAVERVLAQLVPAERHRTTPRLAGAFVFDSVGRSITLPELSPVVLWCPSSIPGGGVPDASERSCPTLPDIPDLQLGPFTFGTLPILPSRGDYLDFIETYSPGQSGEVSALAYRTPEFATTADHVDFGEFGVVTFLNEESFAADEDDAFSYCVPEEPQRLVFRSPRMQNPTFIQFLLQACIAGAVQPELCQAVELGLLPIELLPDWHEVSGESSYEVGLFWEFPFLLRMEYRAFVAGSVSAFGLSVPFGLGTPTESLYGGDAWLQDEFPLDPALLQCRRFCTHPTFDSAGVYHVTDRFKPTYLHACYQPVHPRPGDSGFPLDP
jgi:hypothetical protein